MKKLIKWIILGVVVIVVGVALAIHFFLDSAIKKSIETVGPMLTKVEITLGAANLSILSGSGSLKDLIVGNPEGYKSPSAISVGKASLAVQPGSVFSDKIVIKSINVQAPEITFETDFKGNNLSKILSNVEEATGGGKQTPAQPADKDSAEAKAQKKLQVDDFVISGGKIHVNVTALAGKGATVPLPEIHLQNLGQGPEGITAAELTKLVLNEIEKAAVQAASATVADLKKSAAELTQELRKDPVGTAGKATKAVGNLFKKKE